MVKTLQSLAIVLATLGLALISIGNADAQPQGIRVGSNLIVERVSEISTQELWHLGVPQHATSRLGEPPGGAIGLWEYDGESGLHDDGWFAICLIMVGFGDIAETPVALRVWSRAYHVVTIAERSPGDGRVVSFGVGVDRVMFVLSHDAAGAVFVDDDLAGEIR
jgi:hypothetical protein